jgi:hypothetical protein
MNTFTANDPPRMIEEYLAAQGLFPYSEGVKHALAR